MQLLCRKSEMRNIMYKLLLFIYIRRKIDGIEKRKHSAKGDMSPLVMGRDGGISLIIMMLSGM
jgi:hypothetical protein